MFVCVCVCVCVSRVILTEHVGAGKARSATFTSLSRGTWDAGSSDSTLRSRFSKTAVKSYRTTRYVSLNDQQSPYTLYAPSHCAIKSEILKKRLITNLSFFFHLSKRNVCLVPLLPVAPVPPGGPGNPGSPLPPFCPL